MTVNDNWELSTRKDGPHGDKTATPIGAPSTPDQEIPAAPSELNDLAENTFKEEDTTPNERPTIVSYWFLGTERGFLLANGENSRRVDLVTKILKKLYYILRTG